MAVTGSRAVTAVSKAVSESARVTVAQKLERNVYAQPSRKAPNGLKLQDGAIQRQSVQANRDALLYVSQNESGVGTFKREQLDTTAVSSWKWSNPWDGQHHRERIARIYMPQQKHVHCHPTDKTKGNYWTIEFATSGNFKHALMGHCSGTHDPWSHRQTISRV